MLFLFICCCVLFHSFYTSSILYGKRYSVPSVGYSVEVLMWYLCDACDCSVMEGSMGSTMFCHCSLHLEYRGLQSTWEVPVDWRGVMLEVSICLLPADVIQIYLWLMMPMTWSLYDILEDDWWRDLFVWYALLKLICIGGLMHSVWWVFVCILFSSVVEYSVHYSEVTEVLWYLQPAWCQWRVWFFLYMTIGGHFIRCGDEGNSVWERIK